METRITTYVENLTKITAEKERIATELSLASKIQLSMLPDSFPAFPDRTEFDLFASMDPAKEVGGDFYDFFMIDDDHLCIVIADVSGKGIPGALFMMASKIIIASCAMLGRSAAEILEKTNEAICSNNKAEMFVTVWLGMLELSTGKLTAANAGHEYPVLGRAGGQFELYKDKHGFVIGGMEGVKYKEYEISLSPGDKLFLYTDGVPEAADAEGNMFGTERMPFAIIYMHYVCYCQVSEKTAFVNILSLLDGVVCVAGFAALTIRFMGIKGVYWASIFNGVVTVLAIPLYAWIKNKRLPKSVDDMMAFPESFGAEESERMDLSVLSIDDVVQIAQKVQDFCLEKGIDERRAYLAGLSMEEMAGNIVDHGFTKDKKRHSIDVRVVRKDEDVILRIRDDCVPFDPGERQKIAESDEPAKNIGIRMVFKTARDVEYQNILGMNVLTVRI